MFADASIEVYNRIHGVEVAGSFDKVYPTAGQRTPSPERIQIAAGYRGPSKGFSVIVSRDKLSIHFATKPEVEPASTAKSYHGFRLFNSSPIFAGGKQARP